MLVTWLRSKGRFPKVRSRQRWEEERRCCVFGSQNVMEEAGSFGRRRPCVEQWPGRQADVVEAIRVRRERCAVRWSVDRLLFGAGARSITQWHENVSSSDREGLILPGATNSQRDDRSE